MNKNLTSITYIPDRSGSMAHLTEPAISGFNTFVKGQMDTPGDANLTLVLFDDEYEVPIAATPLQHIRQLTTETFIPRRTHQQVSGRPSPWPSDRRYFHRWC